MDTSIKFYEQAILDKLNTPEKRKWVCQYKNYVGSHIVLPLTGYHIIRCFSTASFTFSCLEVNRDLPVLTSTK